MMKENDIRPQALFNRYLELVVQDGERLLSRQAEFVDVPCPGCGEAAQTPAFEKLGYAYVTCPTCLSLYQSPRPTPAVLDDFYRESESARFWSTDFYKQTVEARRERMFRPRAQLTVDLVAQYGLSGELAVVDVGAGYGIFLEEVRKLGCFAEVLGIEPNPPLAQTCRDKGFAVVESMVEAIPAGSVQADIASAFEVLEHVYDPLAFLTASRAVLKPGGLMLFTTLSVSGFDIQVLWQHAKCVFPPQHLNFLSVEGMRILVERAGLQVEELSTPGVLDVDIVQNTLRENPEIPVPRFVTYLLNARDESTRQAFQRFLTENRLSSHIRVVARAN